MSPAHLVQEVLIEGVGQELSFDVESPDTVLKDVRELSKEGGRGAKGVHLRHLMVGPFALAHEEPNPAQTLLSLQAIRIEAGEEEAVVPDMLSDLPGV